MNRSLLVSATKKERTQIVQSEGSREREPQLGLTEAGQGGLTLKSQQQSIPPL
jgi:hypothetical protein